MIFILIVFSSRKTSVLNEIIHIFFQKDQHAGTGPDTRLDTGRDRTGPDRTRPDTGPDQTGPVTGPEAGLEARPDRKPEAGTVYCTGANTEQVN